MSESIPIFPGHFQSHGLDISTTAQLLKRYVVVETELLRLLAGWYIAAPAYEMKYEIAHHLIDPPITWTACASGWMRCAAGKFAQG